jgi:type I restriction enzyme R subunit
VLLQGRVRNALARLNPSLTEAALDDAFRALTRPASPVLLQINRNFHRMLIYGVPVSYRREDGEQRNGRVRVLDFDNPLNNSWLAVN